MIIAVSTLARVTAIGTTIAAVARAVAATAAWRSAGASLESGRDPREALALGIVPSVFVRTIFEGNKVPPDGLVPFDYFPEVTNGLSPDATDVVVEIRYGDATVDIQRRERIPQPPMTNSRGPVEPPWKLPITGVEPLGNGPYGDLPDRVESIVVSYSDIRDIARYEMWIGAAMSGGPSGLDSPFDSGHAPCAVSDRHPVLDPTTGAGR